MTSYRLFPISGHLIIILVSMITMFSLCGYATETTLSLNADTVNDSIYTTITIHGQLLLDGIPKEGVKIGVAVSNRGNYIFADEMTTDTSGHYETSFRLENTESGAYEVFASSSKTQTDNIILISQKIFTIGCIEEWSCSDWSICSIDSQQTRTCNEVNSCGTTYDKPDITQTCIPTCATKGGDICSSSEDCDGSFIDASDSSRCCTVTCKAVTTTGTGTSGSSGDSGSTAPATDDGTDDDDIIDDMPDDDDDTPEPVIDANVSDVMTPVNETLNETENDTQVSDDAPTGRFGSVITDNRWMIINIILLVMILYFAQKLLLKNEGGASQKYSFKPDTGRSRTMKAFMQISGILAGPLGGGPERDTGRGIARPVKKVRVMVVDNDQ